MEVKKAKGKGEKGEVRSGECDIKSSIVIGGTEIEAEEEALKNGIGGEYKESEEENRVDARVIEVAFEKVRRELWDKGIQALWCWRSYDDYIVVVFKKAQKEK